MELPVVSSGHQIKPVWWQRSVFSKRPEKFIFSILNLTKKLKITLSFKQRAISSIISTDLEDMRGWGTEMTAHCCTLKPKTRLSSRVPMVWVTLTCPKKGEWNDGTFKTTQYMNKKTRNINTKCMSKKIIYMKINTIRKL